MCVNCVLDLLVFAICDCVLRYSFTAPTGRFRLRYEYYGVAAKRVNTGPTAGLWVTAGDVIIASRKAQPDCGGTNEPLVAGSPNGLCLSPNIGNNCHPQAFFQHEVDDQVRLAVSVCLECAHCSATESLTALQ